MQHIYRLVGRLALALASAACDASSDDGGMTPSAGGGGHGAAIATGGGGSASHAGGAGSSATGGGGTTAPGVSGGAGGARTDAAVADAAQDHDGSAPADSGAEGGVGPLPDQGCLEGVTDYLSAGPFDFEAVAIGSVKVWVPDVPEGCKLPVVHFGNGTGATCSTYTSALEHLASHGFLTACYESTQTGEGTQCIAAVEAVYAEYPELASTQQVGFTGNGTGGAAAYVCAYRAEEQWGDRKLIASHAVPPDVAGLVGGWRDLYAQVDTPVFVMNGSVDGMATDGLVSEASVRTLYEAFNERVEAYWYEGVDAPHIPVPSAFLEESAVAWFRWQLLGDAAACAYVKAMPDGERWNLQAQQNEVACE